jgi:uncharacterized coiled-coil protein SlyX
MRLSSVARAVLAYAVMSGVGFVFLVLSAIADNGEQPQPPRENVADGRIAALERQVAQQDQTLVLMRLMLGQVRQDLEEVRKHQKPTGLRYTQEVETATGDVIPGRWEWFVNFSEVKP